MANTPHSPDLFKAKEDAMDNLEIIRMSLVNAVNEGMIDLGDSLYNTCLGLIDDVPEVETWDDMEELVLQAKTLEQDVDAWLSMRGETSFSLTWPRKNS